MTIMDRLKAFFGISGSGDANRRAAMIANLADESANENRALNEQLQRYARADDPFKAMVIDLHNRRVELQLAKGNDGGR